MMEEKNYYTPGMVVTLKQDLPNKPIMLVSRKETIRHGEDTILVGMRCKWFTEDGSLLESVFNTKDLVEVK